MNAKDTTKHNISQLSALAQIVYRRIPPRLRWVARALAFCWLLPLLRLEVWIVEGDELSSRMPLSILCAASGRTKSFLLGLTFGDSFRERYLGRAWLWNIPKVIAEKGQNCTIAMVEVCTFHRMLLRTTNWFYIPGWVAGEVDIPCGPAVMKNESIRSDLRRVRKHGLQCEVTRDPKRFDDFYHNMYVPYITKAHGDSVYIIPYQAMARQLRHCDLLLVKKQEMHIAGILIVYDKRCPRLWSLGIRDGNPDYLKEGVVSALFHYSVQYLEKKCYTKVCFGLSRAFLRDGVLRYKKKWAQKIVDTTPYGFAMKVLSCTPATKAFLLNNPFIFESRGIMHGAVFIDAEKPLSVEELELIDKSHFLPGLSKLFIYHFQSGEVCKHDAALPGLAQRIVLCSAEDVVCRM